MDNQTLQAYPLFPLFSSPTFTFSTIVPKTESLERLFLRTESLELLFLKRGCGKGGQVVAGGSLRALRKNIHRQVFLISLGNMVATTCPPLPPIIGSNTHTAV